MFMFDFNGLPSAASQISGNRKCFMRLACLWCFCVVTQRFAPATQPVLWSRVGAVQGCTAAANYCADCLTLRVATPSLEPLHKLQARFTDVFFQNCLAEQPIPMHA